MSIADSLKKARGDMSQSELARQSGVNQRTISAIEHGKIKLPTYKTAESLGKVLNVDPLKLLGAEKKDSTIDNIKQKLFGGL